MNSFSSTGMFKNSKNLSLNSLKQLLKFNQAPLPNYIPLKNQSKANLKSSLELKNTRSHTARDLTSNPDIEALIVKTLSTRFCVICNKAFDFNNKRYIYSIRYGF